MTEPKKTSYSGVKIVQQPGGNSSYSVSWGHESEAIKRPVDPPPQPIDDKNPEKLESSSLKVVQNSGDVKKSSGVKIMNPPGGKSSFTFG